MILSTNDIKAELSYAYLHAVAARAGLECDNRGRHSDAAGVDATLTARERFQTDSFFTTFSVDIQLKSTSSEPVLDDRNRYSFRLALDHYDKLRNPYHANQLVLVVLFLPEDEAHWLQHSEDGLIARRCAYWVSLRGAPASDNATSQTIYIPRANRFSVESLRSIMARASLGEGQRITYEL